MTVRRWVIVVAVFAGLFALFVSQLWIPAPYRDDSRSFLNAVRAGMTPVELSRSVGPPDQKAYRGDTLGAWGDAQPRPIDAETWVYYRSPAGTHRFAVVFRNGRVAKIIHDKT
jgi:hypothetical protein